MCCSVFEVFVDVVNGVGVFDDVGFNGVDVGVGVVSVDVNLIRLFKNCTLTFII